MKKIIYSLIMLLGYVSCDDANSESEIEADKLLGTWAMGTAGYVLKDGGDISVNYPDLSIVLKEGQLEVTGGGNLFPVSQDVWSYTNLQKTQIVRISDEVEFDIEVTDDFLILRFFYSYTVIVSGGRTNTISGNYEIGLEKSL